MYFTSVTQSVCRKHATLLVTPLQTEEEFTQAVLPWLDTPHPPSNLRNDLQAISKYGCCNGRRDSSSRDVSLAYGGHSRSLVTWWLSIFTSQCLSCSSSLPARSCLPNPPTHPYGSLLELSAVQLHKVVTPDVGVSGPLNAPVCTASAGPAEMSTMLQSAICMTPMTTRTAKKSYCPSCKYMTPMQQWC